MISITTLLWVALVVICSFVLGYMLCMKSAKMYVEQNAKRIQVAAASQTLMVLLQKGLVTEEQLANLTPDTNETMTYGFNLKGSKE